MLSTRASKYGRPSVYWPSRIFEILVITLILSNAILLLLLCSRTGDGYDNLNKVSLWVEFASAVVFTVEYLLRLWSCVEDRRYCYHPLWGRLRWAVKMLSILDLVAIVPFYIDLCSASDGFRGATAPAAAVTAGRTRGVGR